MEHNTAKEKRQEDAPPAFPRGKMLLSVLVSLIVCGILVMTLMAQKLDAIRRDAESVSTGSEARELIQNFMGSRLPESATAPEYRSLGWLESVTYITLSFNILPQDYEGFIARAKPPYEITRCVVLPLKPEGKQANKPDCYSKTMTISIDKSNPAVWHATIDVR